VKRHSKSFATGTPGTRSWYTASTMPSAARMNRRERAGMSAPAARRSGASIAGHIATPAGPGCYPQSSDPHKGPTNCDLIDVSSATRSLQPLQGGVEFRRVEQRQAEHLLQDPANLGGAGEPAVFARSTQVMHRELAVEQRVAPVGRWQRHHQVV